MVSQGHRAVMLYIVQRTDCASFRLAGDIDPAYASAFAKARSAGVEALCYGTRINRDSVEVGERLQVDIA